MELILPPWKSCFLHLLLHAPKKKEKILHVDPHCPLHPMFLQAPLWQCYLLNQHLRPQKLRIQRPIVITY